MKKEDLDKLAKLSRLSITDEEKEKLALEFDSILGYVSEIEKVSVGERILEAGPLRNVMREDGEPHESGLYTKAILNNAPDTEDGYLKVKQVF
ncbi:MAG: Aspartyl/glutamyl-tRNA(Asn/Gln) amidotransferase subunit C [Parcubacteria group bacterium LiPW_30]|nr:MAG: Aspartyl/glutamyl-tRNA(Asn/Gln) amidotransferase subunit C [Parcubacteria group bacterium LiPW_30]